MYITDIEHIWDHMYKSDIEHIWDHLYKTKIEHRDPLQNNTLNASVAHCNVPEKNKI